MTGFLCPCCAEPLIFHVSGKRKFWYCISCHQEMPVLPNKPQTKGVFNTSISRVTNESTWVLPQGQQLQDRIIKTTSEGSLIVDRMGNIAFANIQIAEMLGYSIEQMLWLPLLTFIALKDRHNISEKLVRFRQGGEGKIECRFRHKNGSEVVASVSTNSIFTENNRYTGTLLAIANITKQKQAEAALNQQQEREKVLHQIGQAIRSSLDLETIFSKAILSIGKVLQADYAIIVQYIPDRQVWLNVAESKTSQELPTVLGQEIGDSGGNFFTKMHQIDIVCSDCVTPDEDKLNRVIAKTFPGHWLLVPLYLGASVWGAIAVAKNSHTIYNCQESESQWLQLAANQLSMAIDRVVLCQQLEAAQEKIKSLVRLDSNAQEKQKKSDLPYSSVGDRSKIQRRTPSGPVAEEGAGDRATDRLLISYVGYYLSRGKPIMSQHSGIVRFNGLVYDYHGYHKSFQSFWQKLRQRHDFHKLYLEDDIYCFGDFLNQRCTVRECARCQLPIPVEDGNPYQSPGCNGFCELKSEVDARKSHQADEEITLTSVLAVGRVLEDRKTVEQLLARNGFAMNFVSHPEEIIPESLPKTVDIIVINAEVTSKEAEVWTQQLRRHPQLLGTPIVALSEKASKTLPWKQRSLGIEDYLLTPLGGDRLASHLRQVSPSPRPFVTSNLNWFPR